MHPTEVPLKSSTPLSNVHASLLAHGGAQCPSVGKTVVQSISFNFTIVRFAGHIAWHIAERRQQPLPHRILVI